MDVAVGIVAWNSERDLPRCLDALAAQSRSPVEVIVVDNGSTDASAALAGRHAVVSELVRNGENRGFAAAQNEAIRRSHAEWFLALNPDVTLASDFLERLLERASADGRDGCGSLCGKLLRCDEEGRSLEPPAIDSAGIVFTRAFRHLDRGAGEADRGQWDREEMVFGASGAAALYRRSMIEDVSVEGEFFDEAFFAYREDADVAWRAQLLGWECRYVPAARGLHRRRVTPERRRSLPAGLNRASVKNRFLMRIKNADAAVWRRCGWRGAARDLVVVGGCVLFEWRSLPGFVDVLRLAPRALRHRGWIQARRRRPGEEIARWFV